MKRNLKLKREALTELTSAELGGVAGGVDPSIGSCPVKACVNEITDKLSIRYSGCGMTCYCSADAC